MPKCCICGGKATIYTGERWWCEHHYLLMKSRAENVPEKSAEVELGLAKI